MKHSKRFQYYQPNKMDLKDQYGDCQIRALSKAFNVSWMDAFEMTIPICKKYQTPQLFNLPCKIEQQALAELGFVYQGISNKKGAKRPTIDSFAKDHPEGTYIVNVANHEVAVVDGEYYDTWDSGSCSLYGYYERV